MPSSTLLLLLITATLLSVAHAQRYDSRDRAPCSTEDYESCIRLADPLMREARLIFPDNAQDIARVCDTWNEFVDCLKGYTDRCFTEQQRRQFNRAVESPIETVHQMCTQPEYRSRYLLYATCIKSTITEREYCGLQYNLLVEQVSQGETISKSTLCCSHDRFKNCVSSVTTRVCGTAASSFSSQIIDKALSFLQDQCYNYIPNSGDCNDLLTVSSSSSEVYPWSTVQDNAAPKEMTPSRGGLTSPVWLPSSSISVQNSEPTPTQMLGSRTRPASYGRSSSWNEPSSPPSHISNTVQMYPDRGDTASTESSRPDWATVSSWQPDASDAQKNDDLFKTTTRWYAVAGMPDVDEPNQQGLTNTKPRNNNASPVIAVSGALAALILLLHAIRYSL